MNGLYKGRYIIAVYDDNDNLIDVVNNPKELKGYESKKSAQSVISRAFNERVINEHIYFIDVFEKQDDIFSYEDEQFIHFLKETTKRKKIEEAKDLGMSVRNLYSKRKALDIQQNKEL